MNADETRKCHGERCPAAGPAAAAGDRHRRHRVSGRAGGAERLYDWPMRVIARRLGAAYTLCEVLLDQFVVNVSKGGKARRFLRASPEDRPCGAQLMGDTPRAVSAAARKLVEAGFQVIDLNFGCPVKKVLGRCRGGLPAEPAGHRAGDRGPRARRPAARGAADHQDAARQRTTTARPRSLLCHLRRRAGARRGCRHRSRAHRAATLRRASSWNLSAR